MNDPAQGALRLASARGRWVLAATVMGSGVAFLDSTVVNVALPHIGLDLDASFAGLQWTVNAYVLALAGLLLLAGSLGDRLGRRRVFLIGVVWFALASLACALAPTVEVLIGAREMQGVGGALLTPTSLALIQAAFHPEDRAAAIGVWTGFTGLAAALGPFLGGWMIDVSSWRLIFLINLPIAAAVVMIALVHVPESRDPASAARSLDLAGVLITVTGLAALTYALTEGPAEGWAGTPAIAVLVATTAIGAFLVHERRAPNPLVPLSLFASRTFSAANGVTFIVYAALSAAIFLLPIQLQQVVGYTALQAGLCLVPVTVLMLAFSPSAGRLSQRVGPRLPLTLGPLVGAAGLALMVRVGADAGYLLDILAPTVIFGAGLTLTVAPLTAAVLAAAPQERVGVASGVNTAVARTAGLVAVALIPVAAGIGGSDYLDPVAFDRGFVSGMSITAGLCAAGGLLALVSIGSGGRREPPPASDCEPGPAAAGVPAPAPPTDV